MEKFCKSCEEWLPLTNFGARNGDPHGYPICKECNIKNSRASKLKRKLKSKLTSLEEDRTLSAKDVDRKLSAYSKDQFKLVYEAAGWRLRWRRSNPGMPVMGPGFNRKVLAALDCI